MNPMTNVKNIKKLSEQDIRLGGKSSWHDQYKDSAWIFIGGLPYDLTEGDIICVFSQYGEVVHINLVRDKESGKQKGFCFLCYEDQRSTILAVDNINSIKILGRTLRVDHVENYKAPKEGKKYPIDDETRELREKGCAPTVEIPKASTSQASFAHRPIKTEEDVVDGVRLPMRLPIGPIKTEKSSDHRKDDYKSSKGKSKKEKKKSKKNKKSKSKKRKHSYSSSDSSSDSTSSSSESSDSDEDQRRKNKKKRR